MRTAIATMVQSALNRAGYQVRRIEAGVSYSDPLIEMQRLVGADVRTIFEVGAADGRDSLKFADSYPKANVVAFEPLPENYRKLAEAAAGRERITPVNAAVADASGSRRFYRTALADASSLLVPKATGSTFDRHTQLSGDFDVEVLTLDGYSRAHGIDCIDILKLDVQGAELLALKGAQRLLGSRSVRLIYTEVNFIEIYESCAQYHEVASFLAGAGYQLHSLYGLVHNQAGRLAWGDAIFVPRGA